MTEPTEYSLHDEAHRLIGVGVSRLVTFSVVLVLLGANPLEGLAGLLDTHPLVLLVGAVLGLRAIVPMLRAVYCDWLELKQRWAEFRSSYL